MSPICCSGVPLAEIFAEFNIDKRLNVLYMDEEAKKVFTPRTIITFRNDRKLSGY